MEYALRGCCLSCKSQSSCVLILVLMEYALRENIITIDNENFNGLNPCFNGICSASLNDMYCLKATMS